MTTASAHTLQRVHGQLDDALSKELLDFWSARNALTPEQGRERLPEVLALLRNAAGEIVGVNSAGSVPLALFANQPFHVYRCLLTEQAAEPADWLALLSAGCEILDEGAQAQGNSGEIGLLVQIVRRDLQSAWPEAIWPRTGLVHAGYTDRGHQLRVRYYANARIHLEART